MTYSYGRPSVQNSFAGWSVRLGESMINFKQMPDGTVEREPHECIKDVTFSSEGALYTVVISSSTIEQMVSECS